MMFAQCSFKNCQHESKQIDLDSEEHICDKKSYAKKYYHKDCYTNKCNIEKAIDLWYKHIDKDVSFPSLMRILKELVFKKKNDSGYIVFALKYCIDNDYNLNYPPGLRYFIERQEIKDAYAQKKLKQLKAKGYRYEISEDDSPKFAPVDKRPKGFSSIFKKG